MKKPSYKPWLLAGVAALLTTAIVRSVLAGPQNIPTATEIDKAKREVVPSLGSDERTLLPDGDWIAGNGVVEPSDRETRVSGEVAGRIAAVLVKEGQWVEKGTPLVELENGTERAALEAAKAETASVQAELTRTLRGLRAEDVEAVVADTESVRARAALSKNSLERIRTLAKTGAATPDELDRAERQAEADQRSLESAEAKRKAALAGSRAEDILVARARVLAAAARVSEAEARLARTVIRSAIAAEVLQVKVRAGEYYAPSSEAALLVLGDTHTLRVRIDVDERDVAHVRLGAKGFVTTKTFPGRRIPTRVVELGRRMGRKNVRTDDPVERIDTKILEVVTELEDKQGLVPGLRVIGYVERAKGGQGS